MTFSVSLCSGVKRNLWSYFQYRTSTGPSVYPFLHGGCR